MCDSVDCFCSCKLINSTTTLWQDAGREMLKLDLVLCKAVILYVSISQLVVFVKLFIWLNLCLVEDLEAARCVYGDLLGMTRVDWILPGLSMALELRYFTIFVKHA